MRITNKHGLPEALVRAVTPSRRPREDRLHVTQLIGPAWQLKLKREHWDEIEEDATDRLWALEGQIVHGLLAEHGDPNAFVEERLSAEIDGIVITGQSDLLGADMCLIDWKRTTVRSHGFGVKDEWIAQLNIYAWLWRRHGYEVRRAMIVMMYRDWHLTDANRSGDYPQCPIATHNVTLWHPDVQGRYVRERIAAHRNPQPCTPHERWQTADTWAVKKTPKSRRAIRVYRSPADAKAHADRMGYIVEYRKGESRRCKHWCPVWQFCEIGRSVHGD